MLSLEWVKLDISNLICKFNCDEYLSVCYRSPPIGACQGDTTSLNLEIRVQDRIIATMDD